jgi:hypothetical protein
MLAEDHERNMARVVELALAGAEDAHEALLDLKVERHARGERLGPGLETYNLRNWESKHGREGSRSRTITSVPIAFGNPATWKGPESDSSYYFI